MTTTPAFVLESDWPIPRSLQSAGVCENQLGEAIEFVRRAGTQSCLPALFAQSLPPKICSSRNFPSLLDSPSDDIGRPAVKEEASQLRPRRELPQPSTFNLQPSTLNPQPSTFNPQPATCNKPSPPRCEDSAHRFDKPQPPRRCRNQLRAAQGREPVVFSAPAVRRCLPLGRDPAPLKEPLQGRVERAVIDKKLIIGLLLEEPRNSVSVIGGRLQAPEYQHLERSLEQLQPFPWIVYPWIVYCSHATYSNHQSFRVKSLSWSAAWGILFV